MKRGRKPKAQMLKRLHGTLQKCRTKREPVAPPGSMIPTSQILGCEHALAYWNHYLATSPLGMLKPLDMPLLERLALALAMARQAQEKLEDEGLVVETKHGTPVQSAYLPIVNRQSEIARKLAAELGLSVTGRASLDVGGFGVDRGASAGEESLGAFLDRNPQDFAN